MAVAAQRGRDKLTIFTSERVSSLADWVEQLVAESTGKDGKGILPVVGEGLHAPDGYGSDRLFVDVHMVDDDSRSSALDALADEGHPVVRLGMDDVLDVGEQFMLWELATAVAGHLLGINPFDQPNVESAKASARRVVDEYQREGRLPTEDPDVSDGDIQVFVAAPPGTGTARDHRPPNAEDRWSSPSAAVLGFLEQARADDYVAIQAYLAPCKENDLALDSLRTAIRHRTSLAVTVGYGPRYLHSTGQLHKGDAGNGLFLQLTADSQVDIPIPDEFGSDRSSLTFGALEMAQALGDRQALAERGRKTMRIHARTTPAAGLAQLAAWIDGSGAQ
jgi:hypothetical protein